ncbi:MAG: YdeI/OmpD-associated family protein [Erysipelotrichaceae bacterium]|nr:YdeI/OmpD-associated family protein [Erysipelotrichaceae bacterium]
MADIKKTEYFIDRQKWREWLSENYAKEKEIWLVFPAKSSGEKSISYNDAVEEALCFGWIDGRTGTLDDKHLLRRFTPRRKGSSYSQPNIERLLEMDRQGLIHPEVKKSVKKVIGKRFIYPEDILAALRKDKQVWKNYKRFSDPYKRIRIAYIDAARKRPAEFDRRLNNFINKTRENKLIMGYGGIDKYYQKKDDSK